MEHISSADLPTGNPGDFEFALEMSDKDFNTFVDIAREFGKDKTKFKLDNLGKIQQKGFFHKDDIEKLFGIEFIDGLKNSVKSEINPLLKEKISFAIVKKRSSYDLEPYLDFPK